MMEKRNFVTSVRTADSANGDDVDSLVKEASSLFGGKKKEDPFEKKASAEDEKADREDSGL